MDTNRLTTPRRAAWRELLEPVLWSLTGTYTFKYDTPPDRGLTLFRNYVDRNLGGFFQQPIVCAAVPEFTHAGRIHLHALYSDLPSDFAVRGVLEHRWRYGMARVREVDDAAGALGYLLKCAERDSSQPIITRALRDLCRANQAQPALRVH